MATVLVVEDDKLSQRILGKILTGAGHHAVYAETVATAWQQLRAQMLVDLVILDNQLSSGWGWEFLQGVRQDLIYRHLPVVVYTGHTERSSILKYVELGVHSMLVKPYKADAIFEEIFKALKADWTARLMEDPAAACSRLKIKESDYFSVLSAAASALEGNIKDLREFAAARRDDPKRLRDLLQPLLTQGVSLGIPALRALGETLARTLTVKDTPATQIALQSLDVVQLLLRQRALGSVGVAASVTPGNALERERSRTASPLVPSTPAASQQEVYCRKTASAPMWAFGDHFGRFVGGRLLTISQLDTLAAKLAGETPFKELLEAVPVIRQAPNASLDELQRGIDALPGFRALYLKIATRLSGKAEDEDNAEDLRVAMDRLGVNRSVALIAAARFARAAWVSSPLDLRMLLEHTIAVMLLSYEFARMLRFEEEHQLAAAGAFHDVGKWVFALGEPALYAIALGLTHHGKKQACDAETEIFGVAHEEAGRRFLELAKTPSLLQAAAAFHDEPATAPDDTAAAVAVVCLANHLAWAAAAEEEVHAKAIQQRLLDPRHEIWETLKRSGVELPMDVPELMEALIQVAKTNAWLSSVLVNWSARA